MICLTARAAHRSHSIGGMSKHNNVNPGFYKTGGREHTDGSDKGDVRGHAQADEEKHQLAEAEKHAGKIPAKKK